MLLPGVLELFGCQALEDPDEALAGVMGHDHVVDVAALGRYERVGEALRVFGLMGDQGLVGVLGFGCGR
jgi:pentatricopeptide repeat protein